VVRLCEAVLDAVFAAGAVEHVLVWTASHPHGFMALPASQIDERKV
jgi:hypothetical protein